MPSDMKTLDQNKTEGNGLLANPLIVWWLPDFWKGCGLVVESGDRCLDEQINRRWALLDRRLVRRLLG
jgi:hypothetical protein